MPRIMSQPINPKLWNKMAPLGRITDYDKVLPVLEVYRCVQSEGSRFGRPTIAVIGGAEMPAYDLTIEMQAQTS